MCTGIVSTESEGIKQHEIISIRGNRVRARQVLMLAIDMVWSVFSLGLLGLSMDKENDIGGCRRVQQVITLGFIGV